MKNMLEKIKLVSLVAFSFMLISCASSKAPVDCKTSSNCDESQKCYQKKYSLDKTGAKIVSTVAGCKI